MLLLLLASLSFAEDIKLLTYNVAAIPVIHGRVQARMEGIRDKVNEKGTDVAVYQECFPAACAATLGAPYPHTVRYKDGISGGDGLLTVSRLPVTDHKIFTYSLNAPLHRFIYGEGDGIAAKGAVAVTVETSAGPLKIFNTHLIAGYPGRDYVPERAAQVYELAAFIREYAGGDPYVVMGDMNFTPASPEYAMLTGLLDLRDACAGCGGTDVDMAGKRIDHIFLSSGMAGWQVLSSSPVHSESRLSDHLAVEATLRPPAKGSAPVLPPAPAISRSRALLSIINQLERFITDTQESIRLNLAIPFYGWSHARWGTQQIRSAWKIQTRALIELQHLEKNKHKLARK